jgi:hypothetical protein
MPSPFPGMNPYLEQEDAWHDFHDRFLIIAAEWLEAQVGAGYIVKTDEHVYIHDLAAEQRAFLGRADVSVAALSPATEGGAAVETMAAPVVVELPMLDAERACWLEIRDRRSRQLITVIELLSPANKRLGPDREQYINKRNQLLANRVNLVEIDLLRGGPRLPFDNLPACDYYAMVSRNWQWPRASLWPLRLRDPLPEIPIPLHESDKAACLNLQQLLHRIYDAASYAKYIYDSDPVPPLAPEDAAWARTFLPSRG